MPAGSRPGERRGGRKKGVPNKAVLARAAEIQQKVKVAGKMMAIEAIDDGMNRYIALAAKFQPNLKAEGDIDTKRFEHYFDKAMELAKALVNYQTPKLQSTVLQGDKDNPIQTETTVNVRIVPSLPVG